MLLCLVSLVAALLYGLSWDNTVIEAKREGDVDLAMLVVFLAVPLGLAAVYALCTCYVRCFLFLLCGAPEESGGKARRSASFRSCAGGAGVWVSVLTTSRFSLIHARADSGG